MKGSFSTKLKSLLIILSILYQSLFASVLAIELGSFSEVFQGAPNTVHAYRVLCANKDENSSTPLDQAQWSAMCEVVKKSELCEGVPEDELITCEDQEEDQIEVLSFGFFWNCLKGLGTVLANMVEFIKEAIFTTVGYAFDSETRDEVNQQAADIYDGMALYITNEYAHLKEENPDSSKAKVWTLLSGHILGDALQFLGDLMKESYVGLGCYHQDAREKKACEYVFNVTMPPASFFALFKLAPKALQAGKRLSFDKRSPEVDSRVVPETIKEEILPPKATPEPELPTDIGTIRESQSGVKPTNPRKRTPVKGLNEDYWKSDDAVMVTKGDQSYPVTYSFDSEIPHSAVFNLIYSDPEKTAKLTALLRQLKVREPSGPFGRAKLLPYRIDREDLKRILEKSDKQLNTFVLRRGVDPDKEFFDLTDLNASYVDDFMVPLLKQYNKDKEVTDLLNRNFDSKSVNQFFEGYKDLADDVFSTENIPASATRDQMWIEMVHNSSENSPLAFRDLMLERYRPLTNSASSHLHVGVPSIVEKDKMRAIGRAIETRIILESARSSATEGKLYATSYSTLRTGATQANRSAGIVRMNYDRFSKPHKAHDLEIRQYNRMEEGMNNIAIVGNMARNHERIKLIEMPKLPSIDDPSTSNLTGALTYAARVLETSGDQALVGKATKLDTLVEEINRAGKITPEQRVRVQEVLKEEGIVELLNENLLMEAPSP